MLSCKSVRLTLNCLGKNAAFKAFKEFHTTDSKYLRKLSSRRRLANYESSDFEEMMPESPPIKVTSNFYGIEGDEGVINVEENPSIRKYAVISQEKSLPSLAPENFKNAVFGLVRFDTENKPAVHGHYEKEECEIKIENKEAIKTSQRNKHKTSEVGVAKNKSISRLNIKSNASIRKDSLFNESSIEETKSNKPNIQLETGVFHEQMYFFREKNSDQNFNFNSNSQSSECNTLHKCVDQNQISSEPNIKVDMNVDQNKEMNEKVVNSEMKKHILTKKENQFSYIDEVYFPDKVFPENKGFNQSEINVFKNRWFNDKLNKTSCEQLSVGDHITSDNDNVNKPCYNDQNVNFIEDNFFSNEIKNEMPHLKRDLSENTKFEHSSRFSTASNNDVIKPKNIYDEGFDLQSSQVESESLSENLYKTNKSDKTLKNLQTRSFRESLKNEPTKYNDDKVRQIKPNIMNQQKFEFAFKKSSSKQDLTVKLNASKDEVADAEYNQLQPDVEQNMETTEEKLNMSQATDSPTMNTAYDYVKQLRSEKKATPPPFKDGKLFKTPETKYDSKGFRILKNQVPILKYYTRDEILTYLAKNVLYADDDLVVINKPYNLVIHESSTTNDACLSQYLEELAGRLDKTNDHPKLFTIHRLDKETTGCLLLARNQMSADRLKSLFAQRKIIKTYWIVTIRVPDPLEGIIDIPISEGTIENRTRMVLHPKLPKNIPYKNYSKQGKNAVTHYKVISESGSAALVEVRPETGVKHQIRVHFGFGLSCPILGDNKYSYIDKFVPQKLAPDLLQRLHVRQSKARHIPMHIYSRSICIPDYSEGRNLFVMAPMPIHMSQNLQKLKFRKS